MTGQKLTVKQVRLLETLGKGVIVAPWSQVDLVKLLQWKLVAEAFAFGADGRLHSSKIWTITEAGLHALSERTGA